MVLRACSFPYVIKYFSCCPTREDNREDDFAAEKKRDRQRWLSIYVMYFTMFLSAVSEYSAGWAHPRSQTMCPGISLGLVSTVLGGLILVPRPCVLV